MKANLLMSTIAAILMLGAIAPQSAEAEILMPITYGEGLWSLDVPDAETTVSAYGGRLRLYDVHIAKMIEYTQYLCTRPRNSPEENGSRIKSYDWSYSADRRKADMGDFTITCKMAQNLANTYGLGKPEATTIIHSEVEAGSKRMGPRTEMIPILDIRGDEIGEWMNFTSSFKPR